MKYICASFLIVTILICNRKVFAKSATTEENVSSQVSETLEEVDNLKHTFNDPSEIPAGFFESDPEEGFVPRKGPCKIKGGECVDGTTCGKAPKIDSETECNKANGEVCCIFIN